MQYDYKHSSLHFFSQLEIRRMINNHITGKSRGEDVDWPQSGPENILLVKEFGSEKYGKGQSCS
jgi:hypothetical protein